VTIDVSNAQCPPQLQPGYNPCHHRDQHYVFFMTRRDEICVRLHSLASKRMARIVLRMHATMTETQKLSIIGVLLLLCGTLGILVMMR
jgi:hypothetical protein